MKIRMVKTLRRLVAVTLLLFCSAMTHAETLTIAVAANVRYAYDELAAGFNKETGIAVQSVSGSTGKIASQVKNGAPYDVFISADSETPEALFKAGLAETKPRVYAYGVLVLWTKKDFDSGLGLRLLNDGKIQKIAIANPKLAPYGRAAMQALASAKLDAAVESKLVYGESISQTTQFVDSGAADIGFIAKSVVIAPVMAGKGRWVEVPKGSYEPIAQAVVVLKHSAGPQSANARRFADYLFTPEARAILAKYGYVLP